MHKKILFSFAFVLLANIFTTNNSVFAQKISKKNKQLAKQLCECGEKNFNTLPKVFKNLLIDITKIGEEKAVMKLMENMGKLNETDRNAMEDFKKNDKDFEKKLEEACKAPEVVFDKKTESERTAILEFMKKDKKCELSYAMRYLREKGRKEGKSEPAYNPEEEKK